jgi:hypothetical protein
MKNILFIAALFLLLTSCEQPITYVGTRLKPTASVNIFYSLAPVKKDYKVIGHMESHHYTLATAKQSFIAKAKKIGADAIVILNVDTTNTAI